MRVTTKAYLAAVITCSVTLCITAGPAQAAASGSDNQSGTVTVGATDGSSTGGGPYGPNGAGSGSGSARPVCTYVSLVLNDEGGIAPEDRRPEVGTP